MRTALVNQPTRRFDAIAGIGPHPAEPSVIESVRRHRRRVFVEWDDGIVLETNLRFSGVWHLYRPDERWQKPMAEARVVIEVPGWIAVCFGAVTVETYRAFDPRRHPQSGGVGGDIRDLRTDLGRVTDRLMSLPDADATIVEALMDQRVMTGLGNVDRSELLWHLQVHPFAYAADLTYADCFTLVESTAQIVATDPDELEVFGRVGQPCRRCHDTIRCEPVGSEHRLVYWCPGCQHFLDRRLVAPETTAPAASSTAHPAEILYLQQARVARDRVKIFDDWRELG